MRLEVILKAVEVVDIIKPSLAISKHLITTDEKHDSKYPSFDASLHLPEAMVLFSLDFGFM